MIYNMPTQHISGVLTTNNSYQVTTYFTVALLLLIRMSVEQMEWQ